VATVTSDEVDRSFLDVHELLNHLVALLLKIDQLQSVFGAPSLLELEVGLKGVWPEVTTIAPAL
jgi:hypothetical protein